MAPPFLPDVLPGFSKPQVKPPFTRWHIERTLKVPGCEAVIPQQAVELLVTVGMAVAKGRILRTRPHAAPARHHNQKFAR